MIDPTAITTWPSALVAVALIAGVVYMRRSAQATRAASATLTATAAQFETTATQVAAVEATLTTNNGGSHVLDTLERIEGQAQETAAEFRTELASLAVAVGELQAQARIHHPEPVAD